ncbi:MAG: prepilin-type N-terminal cleavage/methylation domain-containing protein [Gemmatimonadaceae bacterium]|nr:prepilin-type N-terminal cleavage/methylation domain-containing protein [Gemmatimonadaceae bacterium]
MTLIEVLVVLVILGTGMAVVTLGVTSRTPAPDTSVQDQILAARRDAIESARTITISVRGPAGAAAVTVAPDGSVTADSGIAADPWTGRLR